MVNDVAAVANGRRGHGAIAQLVEHLHGMQGVRSSSLLGSIKKAQASPGFFGIWGRFWRMATRQLWHETLRLQLKQELGHGPTAGCRRLKARRSSAAELLLQSIGHRRLDLIT